MFSCGLGPWCGDSWSFVAVALYRDAPDSEELDPTVAYLPAGQVATYQGVHVEFGVSFLQPADDPPEREVVDIAEGMFDDPVLEVHAPATQHRVETAQQVSQGSMQ